MLAQVSEHQFNSEVLQVVTLLIMTISTMFAAWMAYNQSKVKADLEIAKLEQKRASRRNSRRAKALTEKTEEQTEILKTTAASVEGLKAHVEATAAIANQGPTPVTIENANPVKVEIEEKHD
jgi:hypothetical protein